MEPLKRLQNLIHEAEAIVIGAGAGLSTAAGLTYSGERFIKNFEPFIKRYDFTDMYTSGFYPFETEEERWAYWSKHAYLNRYAFGVGKVYEELYTLVKDLNYFVLTTNVDHQFIKAGFDAERLFATQGNYGTFQCAKPCHKTLYDNEAQVKAMVAAQVDCKIPSELVPKCPVCGGKISMHLRADDTFVEDDAWHVACKHYTDFLEANQAKKVLFLELGVGMNTPAIIKFPFWQMTYQFADASYACINLQDAYVPKEIDDRALCIEEDIAAVIHDLTQLDKEVDLCSTNKKSV